MRKKLILKHAVGASVLLAGCLVSGVVLNKMSANPLSMAYAPPDVRLDQAVKAMGQGSSLPTQGEGDVSLSEMEKISTNRGALIVDARPEVFYRFGHIPAAVSLPRDDFEKSYRMMAPLLQGHRDQVLVIYCASSDCQDSQMVADALGRMGYPHVRLFRGGWSDWQSENLPEEKQ